MPKKGAMPVFKTVDDYIKQQEPQAQKILQELRELILEAVPKAVELPNYKVPTYTLAPKAKAKNQLMIVTYKKFVSFYPYQKAVDHFAAELKGFELGKGTVKFPFNQPLPHDLIKRMVIYRRDELLGGLT